MQYAAFALGFAAGWAARATTESSRSAALTIIAAAIAAYERVKRKVAIERDHLEDLVAEARARAESIGRTEGARDVPPRRRSPFDEAAA